MELLFDECRDRRLAAHFQSYPVTRLEDRGWKGLENGALLGAAQQDFDVLLTADTNLYHQQTVAQYDIAVVVLRGFKNSFAGLINAVPDAAFAGDSAGSGVLRLRR